MPVSTRVRKERVRRERKRNVTKFDENDDRDSFNRCEVERRWCSRGWWSLMAIHRMPLICFVSFFLISLRFSFHKGKRRRWWWLPGYESGTFPHALR